MKTKDTSVDAIQVKVLLLFSISLILVFSVVLTTLQLLPHASWKGVHPEVFRWTSAGQISGHRRGPHDGGLQDLGGDGLDQRQHKGNDFLLATNTIQSSDIDVLLNDGPQDDLSGPEDPVMDLEKLAPLVLALWTSDSEAQVPVSLPGVETLVEHIEDMNLSEPHRRWVMQKVLRSALASRDLADSLRQSLDAARIAAQVVEVHPNNAGQDIKSEHGRSLSQDRVTPTAILQVLLEQVFFQVARTGQMYGRCQYNDTSMFQLVSSYHHPTWRAAAQKQDSSSNIPTYGIALNLKDSQHIMPNLVVQLMLFSTYLPASRLFVSIYESNSQDSTPQWLDLLRLLLTVRGVKNKIVTHGAMITDLAKGRIQTLAKIRNHALDPLFTTHDEEGKSYGKEYVPFSPDYVIFINDVYFCANDIYRLTKHRASISCGLDVNEAQEYDAIHPRKLKDVKSFLEGGEPAPLLFYDTWVARDVQGARFRRGEGVSWDPMTARRFHAGLPAPAYCCWNGLAVLDSAPFKKGLKFRAKRMNECSASECSLLCDDYHRLGYNKVVMDPSVYVAYEWNIATRLSDEGISKTGWFQDAPFSRSSWTQVKAAPHYSVLGQPHGRRVECCDLPPGGHTVEFSQCRAVDVMAVNHTDMFLRERKVLRYAQTEDADDQQ